MGSKFGTFLGEMPLTTLLIALICSGVVPQQPPTIFKCPSSANFFTMLAVSSGSSSYSPREFGSPAFG
ncbi:hypothetical protein DFN09_003657 [Clostridium acetobutylicum]|nr:hypothetical protein [Clostridium acetobutylicum]